MIRIYSGDVRGINLTGKEAWMQLGFTFRDILHHFKGARLGVFLSIVLHANEEYYSFPSYETIQEETGYSSKTISDALDGLCKLQIDGQPILLRLKRKSKGEQIANLYKVFPTPEEIENEKLVSPVVDSKDGELVSPVVVSKGGQAQADGKNYYHPVVDSKEEVEPCFNKNQFFKTSKGGVSKKFDFLQSIPEIQSKSFLFADSVWQATYGQLKMDMSKSAFDTWVKDTTTAGYVKVEGGFALALIAKNEYARDWIDNRLISTIARIVSGITNGVVTELVVLIGEPA